jgi:spermidine/putrescine transport system permease protein
VSSTVEAPRAPARRLQLGSLTVALPLAWLAALVLVPNALLIVYSLWRADNGVIVHDWTLMNYRQVFSSELIRVLLFRTLYTALGAALLATFIAYPLAYFVTRRLGRHRLTAALLVLVPLWVSYLIRVFAWKIILGDTGVINSFLQSTNLTTQPVEALLYTRFAVFLTLTYVAIPYVFVTSYTALERIPPALIEASHDAGASGFRTFRHVVWPLSKQGAAIGFGMAFLIATGDYLTPQLVGGLDGTMFGSIIVSEFGFAANWPLGAAMALTLLAVVLMLLAAVARLARGQGVLE